MWIDEDDHQPHDEELPHEQQERQLQRRQIKLANFLSNGGPGNPEREIPSGDYALALRRARVMLCADELLEASRYAITLLGMLSYEQFSAGGARPAQEKLLNAVMNATEGIFDSRSLFEKCADDVKRSILLSPVTAGTD